MQWLTENDDVSMEYLHTAYERDNKDGVRSVSVLYIMAVRRTVAGGSRGSAPFQGRIPGDITGKILLSHLTNDVNTGHVIKPIRILPARRGLEGGLFGNFLVFAYLTGGPWLELGKVRAAGSLASWALEYAT